MTKDQRNKNKKPDLTEENAKLQMQRPHLVLQRQQQQTILTSVICSYTSLHTC